ncbi:16S rRNA (adenine(1518)-N(6)/adenine(1519)-N(6))-dimethyltransferase RsmA [Frigoriflavimonas asaccharolytica]|uniref:Ribosomal RNA small subunit methyltransferase A n=1 Tax=Frigoriflavimonas asaccharolytica TaxID=2735899 RepID=A0A8J8G551_9FLAO|nr:16S rRNA (adenine(1518)-N(6)/adenine(1519)-N(6))-dimethyltransferase RsmA [Frigoriflavimonas asaccharolytica]NRS91449.1 16S rRNA (adenine1518-N6/adenine1519-N6)-dimethyltransferase [Frigoriflavimonas asaccharolytica]
MNVRAKKHLGQHFLNDENIAESIVESLSTSGYDNIVEVGPGTGVLTKYLLAKDFPLFLAEIDEESIEYLNQTYLNLNENTFVGDFLKTDFSFNEGKQIAVIGNFPYNISSQILFKIIDNFEIVPEMVGMFQKEVAERTAAVPRTKAYGILSILVQAYYDVEYLQTVHENVFTPPPKVKSGVIKLTRNIKDGLKGNEILFKQIVKAGFNQRRKKLSNSLKVLEIPEALLLHEFMAKRAEELSVADFIMFTNLWKEENNSKI